VPGSTQRAFEHPAKVLRDLGISPRKRLSQSFLCQPDLARRIVALADWPPETPIIEIGAGTGVLTDALLERFAAVTAVEVDRTLVAYLRERYATANVSIVDADARALDVGRWCTAPAGVCGNLPYGITTDLLMWIIAQRSRLVGAVVTVQREYAERLLAKPGSKAYGSLSVFAAFHVSVGERLRLRPGAFFPPPSVDSTALALAFRDPPAGVEPSFLERVVRAAFSHRRKLLKTNLTGELGIPLGRVEAAVRDVAGSPGVRAEVLSPEEFLELARRLRPGGGE
jgi:16S rRNA (adenine1518-N6/adenine1519-N6)-dimethyltransferase